MTQPTPATQPPELEIDRRYAHLTRQLEILPPEKTTTPIHVIGAGAVGSFTVLALAKMGFDDITVQDFDTIEIENLNCQFYRRSDIGKLKVVALQELVEDFTCVKIKTDTTRYIGGGPMDGIVIAAVDSMEARKCIWSAHKGKAVGTKLFIDPRMGAESALVYAVKPVVQDDIKSYEKSLYSDERALHERCTAKATVYCACMLSGHVAKICKDLVMGLPYSRTTQWNMAQNAFLSYPSKE